MRTAVDGSFTIEGLDPELLFTLLAVAPGYAPGFARAVDPLASPVAFALEPRPEVEGRDDVLLGRVVDEDGRPVLGAQVSATAVVRGETATVGRIEGLDSLAVTDSEGQFALIGAEPDALYHLVASARALATSFREDVPTGKPIDFELREGSEITGRVIRAGEPVAGAVVGLMQEDRGHERWVGARTISTDAEGRFTFLTVQPEEAYSVYGCIDQVGGPGALPLRKVQSAPHRGRIRMGDLTVEPGLRLAGRVQLADGRDIPPGSSLLLGRQGAWDSKEIDLGRKGTFEILNLPAEAFTLEVSIDGYRPAEQNWSFDPLNRTGLEGHVAKSIEGLNILMEAGEPDDSAALTRETVLEFARRREQVLGGTELRSPQPASRLFVGMSDGSLQCLELGAGAPQATEVSIQLGEPLRFLSLHPTLPIVYALGDEHLMAVQWNSDLTLGAKAFTLLGKARVGVRGTHVALHPLARWALVASYGEDAVSCLPLTAEGLPEDFVGRLGGAGDPRLRRAHQIAWHPSGELAYVPALGADQVAILRVETETGAIRWVGDEALAEGSGPRHMALHPSQPWAFVLGEHSSTITAFTLEEQGAAWIPLQEVSNLPENFQASGSRSSDIHVSADGRRLFAVNREPANDLTAYSIGEEGELREVSRISTGGVHARTFAQGPVGDRLWVGHTKSKSIVTLSVGLNGTLGAMRGEWIAPAEITCVLAR